MRNHILFVGVVLLTAFLVAVLLFYGSSALSRAISFFWPDPYFGKTILFYGDGCDQCQKVDDFIAKNKIESKIDLVRLEVFNDASNEKLLIRRAKQCGLGSEQVGVPFIFDTRTEKCILGSVDIVSFFKSVLK